MVSLYCGFHFLNNVLNTPTIVLYLFCSAKVNVSKNYRPLLPSEFFMIALFFCVQYVIRFKYIIYLSFEVFEFTLFIFCFPVEYRLF